MRALLLAALGSFLIGVPAAAQHNHNFGPDGRVEAETGLFMGFRVDPKNPPPGSGVARAFAHLNDTTYAHVTYGVPYRRGRVIFGGLVGFGELWAVGAHYAAELVVTRPVRAAGQRLEAGVYTVFATPGETMWSIHLNRALGMHRADHYRPEDDVLVARVPVEPQPEPVEAFTMDFEPAEDGADLRITWDRVRVRLPLRPIYD